MAIIKEEELTKGLESLSIYKEEEEKILNSIDNKVKNINNLYKTNNTNKLNDIKLELYNKYKILFNIHNNFNLIVKKTIEKYQITSMKVSKDFSKVGDNK